ncbi:Alpha crystallin/Hsp20 domain and HSP20-like chaperone domain-containing protein [Strongyloides ratti]|uniref:Alpha crystallin/Hsp20 domain and HSP20-like chaperone domain-containing protein n=1 Tax=Strongyloides ratti TaxID=34506 RepID=A0A090MYG6_STRRB|nr:Alpha crystallin/Hsp20 domain and HSP20-like chaperone domain-containing protein [Strongyloides ratti]CEF67149.1 Alpha crystallin/Hsp20 domain and HSP20-like chaperone domain-containing protein [Strongyloides ratti]
MSDNNNISNNSSNLLTLSTENSQTDKPAKSPLPSKADDKKSAFVFSTLLEKGKDQIVCDWPLAGKNDGLFKSKELNDKITLTLDCRAFDPEDIQVSVEGERVGVHCEHQKRKNSTTCERKISRTYKLPGCYDTNTLQHKVNDYGELIITANRSPRR